MNHSRIKVGTVLGFIAVAVATVFGGELKTADDVLLFSANKQSGYKTWSADMTQKMNMFGAEMTITGRTTFKQPHLMRMEMDTPVMGQSGKMLMIIGADKIAWQQMEMAGQRHVVKMDMSKPGSPGGADSLEAMDPQKQLQKQREVSEFSLTSAQELRGQPMYVLEGSWKSSALTNQHLAAMAAVMGKSRMYIGRQDGFLHRLEQFDKSDSTLVMSMDFTNLKFNQDVAKETFLYEPPPGVPVIDMTQAVGQMMGTDAVPPAPTPTPAR